MIDIIFQLAQRGTGLQLLDHCGRGRDQILFDQYTGAYIIDLYAHTFHVKGAGQIDAEP